MKTSLIIPDSDLRRKMKLRRRSRLWWTTDHSQSHDGLGVLVFTDGKLLDGATFRIYRDELGATIESDDPAKVYGALGLPRGERGIIRTCQK